MRALPTRALLVLFCLQALSLAGAGNDHVPGKSWEPLPSPESGGWSKEKLAAAHEYAAADAIHTSAVMVIQHGAVVDQWGDIDKKIDAYSVRKSLLSALYGIYSAEGSSISIRPSTIWGSTIHPIR